MATADYVGLDPEYAPEVRLRAPDGSRYGRYALVGDRMTVGRLPDLNDIALQPDGEAFVTRREHFVFEQQGSRWFVVDEGSVNGTFLKRDGLLQQVSGRMDLLDGDIVCILGQLDDQDEPKYWEFEFGDRQRTRPVRPVSHTPHLLYDASAARLFVAADEKREEVTLRRQAHRLVRFMAERNVEEGTHVLCSHDELMRAVWGDEPLHSREELNRLFWELRAKLQPLNADSLIESVRGVGYRIRTAPPQ